MTISNERVQILIEKYRPVLAALAHYDGCEACHLTLDDNKLAGCDVLYSILGGSTP